MYANVFFIRGLPLRNVSSLKGVGVDMHWYVGVLPHLHTQSVGGLRPHWACACMGRTKAVAMSAGVANSDRAQCKFGQKAKEADVAEAVKGLN